MSSIFSDINLNKYYQIKSVANDKYVRFYSFNTKYGNNTGNDNVFVASSDFGGSKFKFEVSERLISTVFIYCEGHELYDNRLYSKDFRLNVSNDKDSKSCGNLTIASESCNRFAELFKIQLNIDGTVSFYSWGLQKWLSAQNSGKSALIANASIIGKLEKFNLIEALEN
jgi:hypothetical protein